MEKKKLLLVAISVGVFLAIIVSAAILIFSSNNHSQNNLAANKGTSASASRPIPAGSGSSSIPPATVDAAELVRNANNVQTLQPPPNAIATSETTFYINGLESVEGLRIENKDGNASARVTINVPKPSAPAVPDTPVIRNNNPAPAVNRSPAPAATPAAPAAAPKPAAPKPAPAKPAAETKTYTDYWIQTGAFSSKSNAENVKTTLSQKGITSIIENRLIDGKTIYQVRVGPYTTENEAKYWLALVQAIDGFSDSLIRQTKSVR